MKLAIYILVLLAAAWLPLRHAVGPALRRQLGLLPYASVAVLYVVGMVTPWPGLILVPAFLAPLVRPGTRVDIACRYMLLMPLMPAVSPTLMVGSHMIGQFSPLDMLGLGALCASFAARGDAAGGRPRTGVTPEDLTLFLLIVIFGVAGPRFADISLLIRNVIGYAIVLAVPFWIVRRTVRTNEQLFLVIGCLGASAALVALMALWEHRSGWALFDTMSARLSPRDFVARTASVRGGALRATVTMSSPLELGLVMIAGALAIYNTRRLYRSRWFHGGALALVLLGMVATQSRGALLATAVAGLVVLLVQRRYWQSAAALGGVVAAYGMLLLLARSSMRASALVGHEQGYAGYRDYRTLLLERGLEEGRKHPIVGLSLEQVRQNLADLTQGEHIVDFVNTYLNIFLISGLVGLGLCVAGFAAVYVGLGRRLGRNLAVTAERTRAFCLAALTAILVSLFTVSFFGRGPLLLMLVLAFARVMRLGRPVRSPAPVPARPDGPAPRTIAATA